MIRYKSMIIGIETKILLINMEAIITNNATPKNINLASFPFHPNDLNFNAIRGMLALSKREKTIINPTIEGILTKYSIPGKSKVTSLKCMINEIEAKKMALAGVGKPMN